MVNPAGSIAPSQVQSDWAYAPNQIGLIHPIKLGLCTRIDWAYAPNLIGAIMQMILGASCESDQPYPAPPVLSLSSVVANCRNAATSHARGHPAGRHDPNCGAAPYLRHSCRSSPACPTRWRRSAPGANNVSGRRAPERAVGRRLRPTAGPTGYGRADEGRG